MIVVNFHTQPILSRDAIVRKREPYDKPERIDRFTRHLIVAGCLIIQQMSHDPTRKTKHGDCDSQIVGYPKCKLGAFGRFR